MTATGEAGIVTTMKAPWRRAKRHPKVGVATLVVLLGCLGSPAATGQERLPDDNAGTGQYVEPVPDAGGDRRAAPGSGTRRATLPARTRDRLPPGEEGHTLERLATDPGSGAPTNGGDGDAANERRAGPKGRGTPLGADGESAIDVLAGAAIGDDGPGAPIVLLAIAGLTLGGAVLAVRRRAGRR